MKRFVVYFSFVFLSLNLFAVDLSAVKIGDSKSSIVKKYGKPLKEIKSGKYEYDIWSDNEEIWIVLLENEKLDSGPILLDDIFSSLLEMRSDFDELNNYSSDNFEPQSSESTSSLFSSNSSLDQKSEDGDKIDKTLLESTEISILESTIINKKYDPKAGFRLKVKNNGNKAISKLEIILYFYDKNGKIFFEDSRTLIDTDSYFFATAPLKPNYSILMPESSSRYYTVSGMDLDEWDEGKMSFEIIELK